MSSRWTAGLITVAVHLALGWAIAAARSDRLPHAVSPTSITARLLPAATDSSTTATPPSGQPPMPQPRLPAVLPLPIPAVTVETVTVAPPSPPSPSRTDSSTAAPSVHETTPISAPAVAVVAAVVTPVDLPITTSPAAVDTPAALTAEHRLCSERQTARHYPALLRERGIQGLVRLRVKVDENGHAAEVLIADGSGWRLLDEAARRVAVSCPYLPARRGEQRLASWVEYPVRFALQPASFQ
ncbi:energy transducer TonB [Roseateles amylovorans]|uniref:TonB family protein n=1 Tax=Roseateles amylovorans TaxID=2978473 RepID=A0ABY6B063_9BURK|nr:energy transducer TonB [Roseateles amylovorans]UXH77556.1 TonB family protein [Roseateles amylovorans]